MNQKLSTRWARYLGIAAGIAVPAIVIAQQPLPQRNPPTDGTFAPQTLLRAADVEQLRDALSDAIARINLLQSNAGVALNKANLYPIEDASDPIPQNGDGVATASCADANDIMVACRCEAELNGINSTSIELRRAGSSNREDNTSFCVCQGFNVGSNVARTLFARGECLTIP